MFSISGRRPQDNLFLLNGIEYTGASLINVTPGGTSGLLLGIDGVREVQRCHGHLLRRLRQTRRRSNLHRSPPAAPMPSHGSVFEFARNKASSSTLEIGFHGARHSRVPTQQLRRGARRPLHKDKAFLFANYEGYRQNLGESLVTLVPDNVSRAKAVASVQPLLNLWPVANGPEIFTNGVASGIAEYIGTAPQHIREDFGTTRFDGNISAKDTFNAIYTVDDSTASTPSAESPTPACSREPARAGAQRPGAAHILPRSEHRARRVLAFQLPLLRLRSGGAAGAHTERSAPAFPPHAVVIAGSTASNGASSITTIGGANGRVQQCDHTQSLHHRRPRLLHHRKAHHPGRHLAPTPPSVQ